LLNNTSFSALEYALLSSNWINLSHTMKEDEEASSYKLTTVRGKHYGPAVVLVGTELFALLMLHGHRISRSSVEGQYTLK